MRVTSGYNRINTDTAQVLLRPSYVEQCYGISVNTLKKWRQTGRGPKFIRPSSRMVLYRPRDIERWLRQREERGSRA